MFDYQKLSWLNGVHLRNLPPGEYAARVLTYLGEQGIDWDANLVRRAAPLVQEKIETLSEFPDYVRFLFEDVAPDPALLDRPGARGGGGRARGGRAVRSRRDRGRAPLARGAPRPEAAGGVPADPGRGHRLEGLAGAVREPGASRPGAEPRAAQCCASGQWPRRSERVEGPLELQPGPAPEACRRMWQLRPQSLGDQVCRAPAPLCFPLQTRKRTPPRIGYAVRAIKARKLRLSLRRATVWRWATTPRRSSSSTTTLPFASSAGSTSSSRATPSLEAASARAGRGGPGERGRRRDPPRHASGERAGRDAAPEDRGAGARGVSRAADRKPRQSAAAGRRA